MKITKTIILLLITPFCFSCKRIKEKATEAVDKVVPQFDEKIPDTKYNKERFKEFFGFYPTPDVKNLYCYGDAMGFDAAFQFSFNCDSTTVSRIIKKEQLGMPDTTAINGLWKRNTQSYQSSYGFIDYDWWSDSVTGVVMPYCKSINDRMFTYLWYDTVNKKAYYLSYDL